MKYKIDSVDNVGDGTIQVKMTDDLYIEQIIEILDAWQKFANKNNLTKEISFLPFACYITVTAELYDKVEVFLKKNKIGIDDVEEYYGETIINAYGFNSIEQIQRISDELSEI